MIITKAEAMKAEAMKAVIDGITIQHALKYNPDRWIDSLYSLSFSLFQKLESINNTDEYRAHFRIKTEILKYRNFLSISSGKHYIGCWDGTVCTQKDVENTDFFVKWISDTVTMEVEID